MDGAESSNVRSASTRRRILDAAETQFGERGFAATSLRTVTEAAGANVAAVSYHFGSKEGLLRAVVARVMVPVNDERRRRLDELEAGGTAPSVPELIRSFVEPAVNLTVDGDPRSPEVARFIGRVISEPDPQIRQLFATEVDPVEGRYLAALRLALPGLDDATVRFAYTSMLGLLGLHQSGVFTIVAWPAIPDGVPSGTGLDAENLIRFITAGIDGLQAS